MKKILLTTLLGLAVSLTACKKDDAAKTADPAKPTADMKTADKPADMKAPPPAAGGDMTADDYEKKNVAMMDKAVATFKDVGDDCDKGAAALSKFIDDNKADMEAAMKFEKTHADVKKAVDEKYKDKTKAFEDQIGKLMMKCKDNKAMAEAAKKFPG